ncbi:winged helix-turn-helix transcriptional regulator [Ralstonia pseudosolanacearum]|uniref:winged helix-turn-helix transcriptional regulator n=1 Tax=Ralstonia pseudosolanacearum TaxID=1310165 RepID=UPI002675DB54|nr:helix-turn-helix domain-containing protein [Ralstonia pseudosolanacearum]MDO3506235.1 helix-turn-helix domain-containing protein [Ralstonia pseudosolanacearum]MDO3510563.1 helix-turn-helix domain-containing protein [Ralstonia pseudosolanacearum]MDO3535745.1 helix-turn-helix domain-containing protein [Ralstonia pseudosolanacearum]MDO3561194.1 helix-turn-helix domain-containing protein [Ralstonia pseudosolanacearum]MDO3570407.1 helix-turn-helix domain-containing protein [Ralstonia pseudosolan
MYLAMGTKSRALTTAAAQEKPVCGIVDDPYAEFHVVLEVLDRVGDKWTVTAIGALSEGPMRFNAIMRAIRGISHRMLTLTLRGLERDGLVSRTVYATVPPKVEYELTEVGRSLIEPLRTLANWALENRIEIEAARALFDTEKARAD